MRRLHRRVKNVHNRSILSGPFAARWTEHARACFRRQGLQGVLVESFCVNNFRVYKSRLNTRSYSCECRVRSRVQLRPRFLLCHALFEKIMQDQRTRDLINVNSGKKITSSVQQNDARHDRAQHEMSSHDDFARQRTSNFHRASVDVRSFFYLH